MNNDDIKHPADPTPDPTADGGCDEIKTEQVKIMNAINRDKKRVRRLRKLSSVLWIAIVVGLIIGAPFLAHFRLRGWESAPVEAMILGSLALTLELMLIVAVVCTVSLYVRWRSLSQRQLLETLAGIERALQELNNKRG